MTGEHSLFGEWAQERPGAPIPPKDDAAPKRQGAAGGSPSPAAEVPGDADAEPITVTELSQRLQRTLERRFADVEVRGELSGLTRRNHWYFSLRDDRSVIGCVAWARSAARFDSSLKDGDEVVIRGSLTHYGPQGRTQLVVTSIRPFGAGAQRARFEALCRELKALGWFDPEGKRPLPLVPRRVAVITSRSGAAIHDVYATAQRRCPSVPIVLLDVRVQGEGAQASIVRAIDSIRERHEREAIDVVILTRGGGSAEDLDLFNDRSIAEAIRRCAVPLVAAIGHESDLTIAELVADHRASTPTQATMLALPDARELLESIAHQGRRLDLLVGRLIERRRARLRALLQHPVLRAPRGVIDLARERLETRGTVLHAQVDRRVRADRSRLERLAAAVKAMRPAVMLRAQRRHLDDRARTLDRVVRMRLPDPRSAARLRGQLETLLRRLLHARRTQLAAAQRILDLTDPAAILDRGFSITTDAEGRVLRRAEDVRKGESIVTTLADGTVTSTVS